MRDKILDTFLKKCIEMGLENEKAKDLLKRNNLTRKGLRDEFQFSPEEIENVAAFLKNPKNEKKVEKLIKDDIETGKQIGRAHV